MASTKSITKKIALLGNHAVGKTSLISQFVQGKFPDKFLTTIGLKVDEKTVEIGDYSVQLMIWDIAGEDDFTRVPQYYLKGTHGVIYVVDLTRPATYEGLEKQLKTLSKLIDTASIVLAANKSDLIDPKKDLPAILAAFDQQPNMITSAKTGENVEEMFALLAKKIIERHESQGA